MTTLYMSAVAKFFLHTKYIGLSTEPEKDREKKKTVHTNAADNVRNVVSRKEISQTINCDRIEMKMCRKKKHTQQSQVDERASERTSKKAHLT